MSEGLLFGGCCLLVVCDLSVIVCCVGVCCVLCVVFCLLKIVFDVSCVLFVACSLDACCLGIGADFLVIVASRAMFVVCCVLCVCCSWFVVLLHVS